MSFCQKIYALALKIPKGKVATYGQLAKLAGEPGAARAVGACLRINPDAPRIPCHRVVGADGSLTGYSAAGGLTKKKTMLLAEGVVLSGDRVDFSCSR